MIRPATQHDLSQIAQLWGDFMHFLQEINPDYYPISENGIDFFAREMQNYLDSDLHFLHVAEKDGSVIGFGYGYIEKLPPWFGKKQIGMIRYLAVDRQYQRQQIGQMITNHLIEEFRSRGIKRVELYVLSGLQTSGFWKKMGFASMMDRRFLKL